MRTSRILVTTVILGLASVGAVATESPARHEPVVVAQRTHSYSVEVHRYDSKARKMVVRYLESTQIMPGVFVREGSMGEIGLDPQAKVPASLKVGDVVRITETQSGDQIRIRSIVIVKPAK